MLAAIGYEPVGFDTSSAALAAFRADPDRFDLVLTDEIMPGMTGTELAIALHEIRPDVPVILMTGYGGEFRAGSPTGRRHRRGLDEAHPVGSDLTLPGAASVQTVTRRNAAAIATGRGSTPRFRCRSSKS